MFRSALTLAAALSLVAVASHAQTGADPAKVAEVAAGRLTEAKASWWGFDPADATAALQAAIDSRVAKPVVDNVGKP